jgi:hypothetical protein
MWIIANHWFSRISPYVLGFEVFHSGQGNQGKLGKASKQQLENVFGSSKDDVVVLFMLENATLQGGTDLDFSGGSLLDKAKFVPCACQLQVPD